MKVFNIDSISALEAKTVVTVGMFDGLHLGHRHLVDSLIAEANAEGLSPLVVTFDNHPRQVLGSSPAFRLLSTYEERLSLLDSCGVPTVAIVHFDADTAALSACEFTRRYLCSRLNMQTLLLGYDNMFGSRANNDFDLLPQLATEKGFSVRRDEVVMLNGIEISSTKIRNALATGDIKLANAMLGYRYGLEGTVVHGRHIGSSLGFPTANIRPSSPFKMLPAAGVYALRATVDGKTYAAMANLGTQPTFNQQNNELEVHLIDFDGDIYGRQLKVEFVDRIRDIETFSSPEELVDQLRRDREKTRGLV